MYLQLNWIGGFMVGFEILWGLSTVVFDLGIVRIYVGRLPEEENNNE